MAIPIPKKTPKNAPKKKKKMIKPKPRPEIIDVSPSAEAGDQAHIRQGDVRDNKSRGNTF